ncbi:hypothetical protein B484DRAFT_443755 [Ochromonadaceae sp. CCMP2298]|nr:hypothetical protein B484DRAFT_443755 [Ochromonadaceae sp. CCMP2298]
MGVHEYLHQRLDQRLSYHTIFVYRNRLEEVVEMAHRFIRRHSIQYDRTQVV